MNVMFRTGVIGAAMVGAVMVLPRPAASQAVVLGSSASAQCVGADCSVIRFALRLAGQHHFDVIRLLSRDESKWAFDSLISAEDANGNDLGWTWVREGSTLKLIPNQVVGSETLIFTAQMQTWSTTSDIFGPLRIRGRGEVATQQGSDIAEFGGPVAAARPTAAPEPASLTLLGLGLAGVLGARRRRARAAE